jgi:uncharacterized membrane protein (UPF0127 family)
MRIENETRGTTLAERAMLAASSWSRMKGLLGRAGLEPGEGLVIRPCQSIHTCFMAFPIDVLHLDRDGNVLRVLDSVPPWRFGPMVWRGRDVVELPAGTAATTGTREGDRIVIRSADATHRSGPTEWPVERAA